MKAAKRILVVDDEKTILLSLSYALKTEGVDVITCNKSEWAEKALENYYFDLVITDIRLSKESTDKDGLQILELTKSRHPNSRVIVMTAYGTEEVKKKVKTLGADYFFDKPIDLELLLSSVSDLGIPIRKKKPSSIGNEATP